MVRLEEQGCFQEAYPDNNKRPDISLLNLNPHKKIVCDISVAHPYPIPGANTLTRVQALQPLRAANNTFQRKINTYIIIINTYVMPTTSSFDHLFSSLLANYIQDAEQHLIIP